jgi:uncharacterized protein YidB (DUF937 family)
MGGLDDILGGMLGGKRGEGGAGGGGLEDLLGGLTGGQGGGGAGMLAALAPMLMGLLSGGGLQKLLQQFQQQGMGGKAASWVDSGENEPVSAGEVRSALGDEQVAEAARQMGVSEDEAAEALARILPAVVDRATPDAQLPDTGAGPKLTLDDLRR